MVNDNNREETQYSDMPFLEHIEELRQRLIRIFATIIIFSIIAYVFSDILVNQLVKPVGTVYFREPTGAFLVRLKVSAFGGILLSIPVIIYHFWKFVLPGLYDQETKFIVPVTIFGTIFFLGGASFCFFLVIPIAINFLTDFGTETLKAWIDIKEYFSFVFWMSLAFGAVFELPVVCFFLGKLGLITSKKLARGRRYAVIIILVSGTLLTPPDVFSQLLLAVPLYFLYEVSIIVVRLTGKKREE